MNENQKLRKNVLQLHYELSEGNSWNLVMRPIVAERLGFESYNDQKLLAAIKYLEDKGFLEANTNVEDQITTLGIDEVEEGYPSSPAEDDDNENEPAYVEKLTALLPSIAEAYDKGDKELLETRKLEEIHNSVRTGISEVLNELSEEEQLKYKKITSGWTNQLKSGFHNRKTAESRLEHFKQFIEEVIENAAGFTPRNEVYIAAGHPYEGIKHLRAILKTAKEKIWLVDNFLHPEMLAVLEPYVSDANVEIRLVTRSNNNNKFNSLCVDLNKLRQQYPNATLEAKDIDTVHDRYIIIDGTACYHSGHSFHDLGSKAAQINRVEDESNAQKILSDFNQWWQNGNDI